METGDLFRYKKRVWMNIDLSPLSPIKDGLIGVVLSAPNRHGQYKVLIGKRTLWVLRRNMEKL